jgi:hypothetical protein
MPDNTVSYEVFNMAKKLHEMGIYIGPRNPSRNTAFVGCYMVCHDITITGTTTDSGHGGFCIVGDDLSELVVDAYNYFVG